MQRSLLSSHLPSTLTPRIHLRRGHRHNLQHLQLPRMKRTIHATRHPLLLQQGTMSSQHLFPHMRPIIPPAPCLIVCRQYFLLIRGRCSGWRNAVWQGHGEEGPWARVGRVRGVEGESDVALVVCYRTAGRCDYGTAYHSWAYMISGLEKGFSRFYLSRKPLPSIDGGIAEL